MRGNGAECICLALGGRACGTALVSPSQTTDPFVSTAATVAAPYCHINGESFELATGRTRHHFDVASMLYANRQCLPCLHVASCKHTALPVHYNAGCRQSLLNRYCICLRRAAPWRHREHGQQLQMFLTLYIPDVDRQRYL